MRAAEFKTFILERFFQDLQRIENNNYSAERFSYDGVDRSALFDVAKHALYLDWFVTQYVNVFDAYNNLADQESRDLYIDLLRFKLAGHLHVRIDTPVARLEDERAKFCAAFPGTASSLHIDGMFGELRHYDGVWNDTRYTVDTIKNALTCTLVNRQYYFQRNGLGIEPEPGDYVVDGGACTGDTAIVFSRSVGPAGKVYAFDPVQSHVHVCETNFSRPGYENIEVLPYGLSDRDIQAPPVRLEAYSPGFRVGEQVVPLVRIDDLVIDRQIERIDFIKLDVEGSELAALRGAYASIHRFRPKLAVSIYHNPNDFFEIYQFVNGLGLGYTFYLDHYTTWDEETVLYAVCPAAASGMRLDYTPLPASRETQGAQLENFDNATKAQAAEATTTAVGHIDSIEFNDVSAVGSHDSEGMIPGQEMLNIRGWAAVTEDHVLTTAVYVSIDDGPPLAVRAGLERRDVAQFFKNNRFAASGFDGLLSTAHLSPGAHVITLLVRDERGRLITVDKGEEISIDSQRNRRWQRTA